MMIFSEHETIQTPAPGSNLLIHRECSLSSGWRAFRRASTHPSDDWGQARERVLEPVWAKTSAHVGMYSDAHD